MQKIIVKFVTVLLLLPMLQVQAATCPDPNNSSLQQGIIPPPWHLNPFSENKPEAGVSAEFARANILVAGMGRGVMCTYKNAKGKFSIWWQVAVKIPSPTDNNWLDSLGGYQCNNSFDSCVFYL